MTVPVYDAALAYAVDQAFKLDQPGRDRGQRPGHGVRRAPSWSQRAKAALSASVRRALGAARKVVASPNWMQLAGAVTFYAGLFLLVPLPWFLMAVGLCVVGVGILRESGRF